METLIEHHNNFEITISKEEYNNFTSKDLYFTRATRNGTMHFTSQRQIDLANRVIDAQYYLESKGNKHLVIGVKEIKNMTFEQAKELARQGIKMTHQYFTSEEYMTMRGNIVVFEDGAEIFVDEWSKDKDYLLTGWSTF